MTMDEQILSALHQVCDPCSIAAHSPISIVDMGLVRGWSLEDDGTFVLKMCVTSPSCTMAPNMMRGAEAVLRKIEGISAVRIELDETVFWSPDEMTEDGRNALWQRRTNSLDRAKVTPQQWRTSARPHEAGGA